MFGSQGRGVWDDPSLQKVRTDTGDSSMVREPPVCGEAGRDGML